MAEWHPAFPQKPRTQSLESWSEGKVRAFQPDDGPQIARVGGSAVHDCWSGIYGFTLEQRRLFATFWKETINRGVDSFTMHDPIAGVSATVEFYDKTDMPRFREVINGYFEAQMAFRVL